MVVMTRDPRPSAQFMLDDFLSMKTPEGYRTELIDGEIVVTPPPGGYHEKIISGIVKQVNRKCAVDMDSSGNRGLIVASEALGGEWRVLPDVTFAPTNLDLFGNEDPWMPVAGVAMVVEVTSSRPEVDRDAKRRGYAIANIPLYLLADRQRRRLTLFSNARRGDYAHTDAVQFGDSLDLPEPFGFVLETKEF